LELNGIRTGLQVQGTVVDCSLDEAMISFLGVDGTIRKSECSWVSYLNCNEVLRLGDTKTFIIKHIDNSNGQISLSLKLPEHDPWEKVTIPDMGETTNVRIVFSDSVGLKGLFQNQIEVLIPKNEISWYLLSDDERHKFENTAVDIQVIQSNKAEKILHGSIRRLEQDPWPTIHQALSKGMVFNGKICEIAEEYVGVKVDNGLIGRIPKSALITAGYEYANFKQNLVIGQGIDVVVSKVFLSKNYIRFDLQRNCDGGYS
jgi:ribosomal protein S1